MAELDASGMTVIPQKILRRQHSKTKGSHATRNLPGKLSQNEIKMDENLDNTKENQTTACDMEVAAIAEGTEKHNTNKETAGACIDTPSQEEPTLDSYSFKIVAGCRPKIKTKPIVIPLSDPNSEARMTPLKTRYSFSNSITPDRLSTTLPRRSCNMSDHYEGRNDTGKD